MLSGGLLAIPQEKITGQWKPLGTSYLKYGQANRLPRSVADDSEVQLLLPARAGKVAAPEQVYEECIVSNVYPLASPSVTSTSMGDMILFSMHDPKKLWHQATDIAVVQEVNDGNWVLDRIRDDQLAEFSPAIVTIEPNMTLLR
jgi:hypothetical protein